MNAIAVLCMAALLTGCASDRHYRNTQTGTLSGKLVVQWLEPDRFLFLPDKANPLTFIRSNGERIVPGPMYTDGGSIPRPLWALKSYSPWGFAPGFIVHDWIFEMKHCAISDPKPYGLDEAGTVLSEIIKTLMEKEPAFTPNANILYSYHLAVTSPIAEKAWNGGVCSRPIVRALTGDGITPMQVRMQYIIEF